MTPDSDNFYHIVFRVYPYQKEVTFYMAFHAILILPYKYMRFVFFGKDGAVRQLFQYII